MFKTKAYASGGKGKVVGVLSNGMRLTNKGTGTWGKDANGNITFTPKGGTTTTLKNSNGKTRGKQVTVSRTRG